MRSFKASAAIAMLMIGGGTIATADEPPDHAPRAILKEHTKAVWCVVISPDGKFLVSGGGNLNPGKNNPGELLLWNLATGKHIVTLPSQGGRVRALAFSPDGKVLAAGYEPENIISKGLTVLWNFPAKTLKDKIPAAHALAFSSDGKLLALGGIVWDLKRSRQAATLVGHSSWVESGVFFPDGRIIASAAGDRTAILWEADTGKLTTKLAGKLGQSLAIALSPDGATLALGTETKGREVADEVTLVDLKTLEARLKINVGQNINALAFSHDGKTLAVGTGWVQDGETILLDPADGKRIATLREHTGVVKGVCFSPDDQTLATGSTDHMVRLWDVSPKALSGAGRKLPESPPEKTPSVKLPIAKLPEAPAGKFTPADHSSAKLPESVIKFQKSLESLRKLEAVRLKKRIKELQEAVNLAAKANKPQKNRKFENPITVEATALLANLKNRLKLVESDKPYIPRLSPKDFAVGQIGELDDDLLFNAGKGEGGVARVTVRLEELTYLNGQPGIWSRNAASLGREYFDVRGAFVAGLPPSEGGFPRALPTDRSLRAHYYEIVERKINDYVLAPFKMDEVEKWLRDEAKRPKK